MRDDIAGYRHCMLRPAIPDSKSARLASKSSIARVVALIIARDEHKPALARTIRMTRVRCS